MPRPRAWVAAVAAMVLAAMAFHGLAHASEVGHDDCPACAVGAAKAAPSAPPPVVKAEFAVVLPPMPASPAPRAARAPRLVARPPPARG